MAAPEYVQMVNALFNWSHHFKNISKDVSWKDLCNLILLVHNKTQCSETHIMYMAVLKWVSCNWSAVFKQDTEP